VRQNDSVWSLSTGTPSGSVLEFKITRGTWDTEALYSVGIVPQNTVVQVISDTVVVLAPVTWNDISHARGNREATGRIVGTVQYHRGLKGDGLNFDRDLIVWLPPSYDQNLQKRYPVLYMHDGQNIFDPKTSFIGYEWRADEVADSLIKSKAMEEIIIVGINNSPDRISEYSDTPLGQRYARFVVNRVKPLIDSVYRTRSSRENTAVMGGLISFMWHPETFSKAGCLSTSISARMGEKDLEERFSKRALDKNLRIYMDVGELEPRLVPGNRLFAAYLQKNGFELGKNLEFFYAEGALHNEQAWSHRLWRPLKFLFGR
jgi:enterochelin esterase-like enzyme